MLVVRWGRWLGTRSCLGSFCAAMCDCISSFGGGTQLTILSQVSPTVHLFLLSSDKLSARNTLVHLLADFYPGAVQVSWLDDSATLSSDIMTSQPQRQSNNQYMASSYLTLSASDWARHETYTCKVVHEAGTIEKVLNRSECS